MWGWGDDWGVGWAAFTLVHVLWWAIVVALAIVVFRRVAGFGRHERHGRRDGALEILRERYARGEIDATEYGERRKQLQS
jgi:putative membrane protein